LCDGQPFGSLALRLLRRGQCLRLHLALAIDLGQRSGEVPGADGQLRKLGFVRGQLRSGSL